MRALFSSLILYSIASLLTGCLSTQPHTAAIAEQAPTNIVKSAQTMAVLLPLSGPLNNAGQAVRDGFIAAYHNDESQQKPAHILFFDTASQPIEVVYAKALQANADIMVGPLEKNNVQKLVQAELISRPTLSLNYLDVNLELPSNLYQFGLSPADEAQQAATLARQNGLSNALIIVPHNNWGRMLAQVYKTTWQNSDANVAGIFYFSQNSAALSQQINNLLNKTAQKFDVVLLAASTQMARQVKPLLQFYSTQDIPVYATSLIYAGTPQPAFDNDLNNIIFCDMPWTLSDNVINGKLRQQISLFWPASFKQNSRLYALGIDAYQLAKTITASGPLVKIITGSTGNLSMNSQGLITRQLSCAQFKRGIPVLLKDNDIKDNFIDYASSTTENSADIFADDSAETDVTEQ